MDVFGVLYGTELDTTLRNSLENYMTRLLLQLCQDDLQIEHRM